MKNFCIIFIEKGLNRTSDVYFQLNMTKFVVRLYFHYAYIEFLQRIIYPKERYKDSEKQIIIIINIKAFTIIKLSGAFVCFYPREMIMMA